MNYPKKGDLSRYHVFPTPFGPAALVFQREPFLAKQILLPCKNQKLLIERLKNMGTVRALPTGQALDLCRLIQRYFDGLPIAVPWKLLDMSMLTALQQVVLKAVAGIPYGATRSYGEIARQIGRPAACRFVGNTLARNPFPVVIPCHRVIRSDGSVGGFGGGVSLKQRMLALEARSV